MSSDVILAFPGKYGSIGPQMPLALPYLGGVLEKAGYKPRLLDTRVERYENVSLGNALCVGISCMTGPQIKYALEFARYVRERDSDIPIIWGGVHPTSLAEQTVANEYVDIVVRGEGELTLLDLVRRFERGEPFDDVQGITYKDCDHKIRTNPNRGFLDMNTLPVDLPYHLLKLEKYPLFMHRNFDIQTSRGCPYSCTFCYNKFFNKQRYRFKDARLVVDEVEHVVNKYHIKHVSFLDDEFMVGRARMKEICCGLLERGIDIGWNAIIRADTFLRYDDNLSKLLVKSGLRELSFGVETASPHLLKLIRKGITPDIVLSAAKKARNMNITSGYLFMCGLPTETLGDLQLSTDLVDRIKKVNPTAKFLFAIYTPYPGTELYEIILNKDFKFDPPKTLESWINHDFLHFRAPWLDKKYYTFLTNLVTISRFAFWTFPEWARKFPFNMAHDVFSCLARWRWRHRFFQFPIEVFAAKKWRDFMGF